MKIFALILSFYILALTALPCIDLPEDNNLHGSELGQLPVNQHTNESDECSPFCSCSCCVTPIIYQNCSIEFKCYSFSANHYAESKLVTILSPSPSIWQPPKVV